MSKTKTTWMVEIKKTQICVVAVQAEDYDDAHVQARNLAQSIESCDPIAVRYESAYVSLGNIGGRLHAAMHDLHPPSDVMLVRCPSGAVFRPKAAERILEIAGACGIGVLLSWNGNPGVDSMSLRVEERPTDAVLSAFNEALPTDLFVFPRVERALKADEP